jgi:hypothetical protein
VAEQRCGARDARQLKRAGVLAVNRSARRLGLNFDLIGLEERIKLQPPSAMDEPRKLAVYTFMATMWLLVAWILVTYSTLIRAMNGDGSDALVVNAWGMALVIEQVSCQLIDAPPP